MNSHRKSKEAFTLIEVMVAVMIISVVIMALIQMFANNTHLFLSFQKQTKINQYSSFLIANETYGYENKSISMDELVHDFDLRDEVRRELKDMKVKLIYAELERVDLSESKNVESQETKETPDVVLELGKTILQKEDSSSSLLRFRLQ